MGAVAAESSWVGELRQVAAGAFWWCYGSVRRGGRFKRRRIISQSFLTGFCTMMDNVQATM